MKWLYWLSAASVLITAGLFAVATYNRLLDSDRVTAHIANRLVAHGEALQQGDGFIYEENALPNEISVLVYDGDRLVNWSSYYHFPDFSSLALEGDTILFQEDDVFLVSGRLEGSYKYLAITTLKRTYSLLNVNLPSYHNEDIFGDKEVIIGDGESCFSMPSGSTVPYETLSSGRDITDASLFITLVILSVMVFLELLRRRTLFSFLFSILSLTLVTYFLHERSWRLLYVLLHIWLWVLFFMGKGPSRALRRLILRLASRRYLACILYLNIGFIATYCYWRCFGLVAREIDYGLDISLSLGFDTGQLAWYLLLVSGGLLLIIFINLLARLLAKLAMPSFSYTLLVTAVALPYALLIEYGVYSALVFAIFVMSERYLALTGSIRRFSYLTFFYSLMLILLVSSLNAIAIYKNDEHAEVIRKREFANAVLQPESKRLSERLEVAKSRIEEDPNIRSRFLSPHL